MRLLNIKKDTPLTTGIMGVLFGLLATLVFASFFTSCTSDDLAFDVIESPVLALFEEDIDDTTGSISMKATFYELDKSGILDQSIGIDSTIISGLALEIFVNESTKVGSVTTGSDGTAIFEKPISELSGASRLEWVGTFNNTPFRIYRNF